VSRQRRKKDKLLPEQIKQLEELGFVWNSRRETWHKMFKMLHDFKEKNGVSANSLLVHTFSYVYFFDQIS